MRLVRPLRFEHIAPTAIASMRTFFADCFMFAFSESLEPAFHQLAARKGKALDPVHVSSCFAVLTSADLGKADVAWQLTL